MRFNPITLVDYEKDNYCTDGECAGTGRGGTGISWLSAQPADTKQEITRKRISMHGRQSDTISIDIDKAILE